MNFYRRYIRIPPDENIDIRPIVRIVAHPLFQRLLHIFQLGQLVTVFPGATHNRFEHALGVYSKTLRFTRRMVDEGFLTEEEAKATSIFGLLHDIGHGPFSHLVEQLTSYDHDQNGMNIIEQLIPEIEASGVNAKLVVDIFKRKNPLYRIVMDKNLGMDKLDYLQRDTYHLGFGFRPDVETILSYLSFIDGQLAIDIKSLDGAKQIQQLYMYMYKGVYLKKSSLISQRFIQKMIALWLSTEKVDEKELWSLTDAEMMGRIISSKDDRLKFMYQCWKERRLPKTGLVIKLEKEKNKERVAGKSIKLIGESREFFSKLSKYSGPKDLDKIEEDIALELGVRVETICIVPMMHPERFIPENILYHDNGKILSLRNTDKEYFKSLEAEIDEHMTIRVCGIGNRERIAKEYKSIMKILSDWD